MNEGDLTEEQEREWLAWFAGQALIGLMRGGIHESYHENLAKDAFDIAEAMMKERKLRRIPE